MRFLSVTDRELRSAARRKGTYRTRWLTAALFFGLLVWLLWAFGAFKDRRMAPDVFRVYAVLTFLYCLFLGAACTADCISIERREGTLGLLFLTNLNSAEIITGKFCSMALASVFGLMAIFPMLALPLLMGGTTLECFARTVLGLLNGTLFALAAGLLASVMCQRQFTAIALALGLALGVGCGLMLGAVVAWSFRSTKPLAESLAMFSPLYTLIAADNSRVFKANRFWYSAAAVAGTSLAWLGLTTVLLARTWRDRPTGARAWQRLMFWRRSERKPSAKRAGLRRRLLAINPVFWLAAPSRVSAPVMMLLVVVVTAITAQVAAPYFGRVMGAGAATPMEGHLFAWLWAGLAIHALVLYYAAMSASQRLAEDKQTGALELLLGTPTTERAISRGLWLAYRRKMLFPGLAAVLVHCFFVWILLELMVLDPPGRGPLPPGTTPGELFWSALFNQPLRGQMLEFQFGFMLRVALLILLQLMVTWPTLGWVGRWLGVRMKHAGFAPLASLAWLCAPPVLLFTLACYLADRVHLDRLPERRFLPIMMWLGLAIGIGHCLVLSLWAASRLRRHLRVVAMSRYQPLPRWRWRLPNPRTVRRVALGTAGLALALAIMVVGYYGYQNRRSKVAWKSFQSALKQSGESLNLSPLLPEPVPDGANFARSPVVAGLVSKTNRETKDFLERMQPFDVPASGGQGDAVFMQWRRQTNSPLHLFVTWSRRRSGPGLGTKRADDATAILQDLQPRADLLREVAAAAARLSAFQISTNRDAGAVLHPADALALMLERLHLLFQGRACAFLARGQNAEGAEDVLAGLRLARLARQLPDIRSPMRVQALLMRSLQPLWEGLSQHGWTGPQLAGFQRELAGFNLFADYTNAVRRVVLAHIEIWRAIPDSTNAPIALGATELDYVGEPAWELQPRAWWFDSCIQLHRAGRNAIQQVDVAAGRIHDGTDGSGLDGLPLDSSSRELLQQPLWLGPNPVSLAFAQTSVNQASIACALERFRQANGGYPESLQALVPALLDRVPVDAVSGRPVIYECPDEKSFVLRGVGPNGTDDSRKKASDDWLWTYATNNPSIIAAPGRP